MAKTTENLGSRLAVCSWSLQPKSPDELIAQLKAIGILRVQIALDPIRAEPAWRNFGAMAANEGIRLVSGMFGTIGEDYTTMETIRRTGGVVPDQTWDENWKNIQATARLAAALNIRLVTFHAGFLPHNDRDPGFRKLRDRLRQVADAFAAQKIDLALETGQETADALKHFLGVLERPNVGVNFDPANMILYEKGDPIAALETLAPWLKQCHIKDARRTKQPGTWGDEVVAGTGEVDWRQFFTVLERIGFKGDLCIEREAGQQRAEDIRAARKFVESL
jgi:L-ribulose-5-phosphate 3-epimerase